MNKYVELIKILEDLFGKGSVSRTIGTRTNVVRFPKGKQGLNPTKSEFDVEATYAKNPDLVQTIENSIADRMGDITRMNDQELITYTANARRLLNFKQPPTETAEVIKFGSGQEIKGKGLEQLIEKEGTKFSPTTDLGRLEAAGKRLEKAAEEMSPEFLAKQEADRQAMIARQYEGKGYAGGVFGPSGMYRAVARDFLLDQNAKGKIKLNPETVKALEERSYISGGQPLMYPDPIRVMRYHYGDDVFEKIPLDKIPTGARSEIIDVMSKVEAPPIKTEAPKTPGGYLTPGEYKANIEEMQNIENMIKRRESRFADMTEEEIQNELQQYGSKRSAFEMGLEYDYPEEYAKYKGPKKPEPEQKADGGRIGYSGGSKEGILDIIKKDYDKTITKRIIDKADEINETAAEFLRRQVESRLTDEQRKKMNRFFGLRDMSVEDIIKDSSNDSLIRPSSIIPDKRTEEANGGRIGFNKGKKVMSQIDKLIEQLNKKTQGKKSMESVNPKTGEVTVPEKPIRRAEEPTGTTVMDAEPETVDERSLLKKTITRTTADIEKEIDAISSSPLDSFEKKRKYNELHLEFIDSLDPRRANKNLDYRRKTLDTENRLMLKAEEKGLDFDTFEELRKGLYDNRKQKTLNFIKTGKVDLEPLKPITTFEEAQERFKTAAKAADEIFPDYTQPKTAASTLAEVMAEQKYKKTFDQLSGDKQSELYSEAYNYITSINKLPKVKPFYKPGDPITSENFGSTPFAPSQETLDNLKIAREQSKKMSEQELEKKMNEVLNKYAKSIFIKDEFGAVDITNEMNQKIMAELLRRDHPELYNQISNFGKELDQKQILEEFDITGRKPNAKGGIAGLL